MFAALAVSDEDHRRVVPVADLFAAVPARRKFLKTANTEWGHIADILTRAALSRPDVHFDVVRDDKPLWSWPATAM